MPDMMKHICNPIPWEVETTLGSTRPCLKDKILFASGAEAGHVDLKPIIKNLKFTNLIVQLYQKVIAYVTSTLASHGGGGVLNY